MQIYGSHPRVKSMSQSSFNEFIILEQLVEQLVEKPNKNNAIHNIVPTHTLSWFLNTLGSALSGVFAFAVNVF